MGAWKTLWRRAQESPYLIVPGALALLNGYWHKLKFKLIFKDIRIGRAFRVYGHFTVLGFGRLTIGDNCFVDSKNIKRVAFKTAVPGAHIDIGDNVGFNGTTLVCHERIRIADWCNIADAYIVDSPAHPLAANRRTVPACEVSAYPVTLRENVWVSTRAVISHGVTIGRNSVIGALSLVRHDVPEDSFFAGNPAVLIKKIPESPES